MLDYLKTLWLAITGVRLRPESDFATTKESLAAAINESRDLRRDHDIMKETLEVIAEMIEDVMPLEDA